jgi:hypothetical protein
LAPPVPALLKRQSTAELLRGGVDRPGDVGFLRDIAADIDRSSLVLLLDPRAFVVLDVGGNDARAFTHEEIDRAPADAACRPGDDGDLAFQTSCHVLRLSQLLSLTQA